MLVRYTLQSNFATPSSHLPRYTGLLVVQIGSTELIQFTFTMISVKPAHSSSRHGERRQAFSPPFWGGDNSSHTAPGEAADG